MVFVSPYPLHLAFGHRQKFALVSRRPLGVTGTKNNGALWAVMQPGPPINGVAAQSVGWERLKICAGLVARQPMVASQVALQPEP